MIVVYSIRCLRCFTLFADDIFMLRRRKQEFLPPAIQNKKKERKKPTTPKQNRQIKALTSTEARKFEFWIVIVWLCVAQHCSCRIFSSYIQCWLVYCKTESEFRIVNGITWQFFLFLYAHHKTNILAGWNSTKLRYFTVVVIFFFVQASFIPCL